MTLLHKNYISHAILFCGLLLYCLYINSFEFVPATICMALSLLLWIGITSYFETFDKIFFSKLLSISGLILSVSILLVFGIEEVPFPKGALVFHDYGIALSLFVLIISLLPLLYMSNDTTNTNHSEPQSSTVIASTESQHLNVDDDWEIATDDDVESGEFEVAA